MRRASRSSSRELPAPTAVWINSMLAAAILAAGESRRMGTPKALLLYHGVTFVEHLMSVARHPRVGMVRVVLGAGAEDIRAKLNLDADSVVLNPDWPKG